MCVSAKRAFGDVEASASALQLARNEVMALKAKLANAEGELARQSRAVARSNTEKR